MEETMNPRSLVLLATSRTGLCLLTSFSRNASQSTTARLPMITSSPLEDFGEDLYGFYQTETHSLTRIMVFG